MNKENKLDRLEQREKGFNKVMVVFMGELLLAAILSSVPSANQNLLIVACGLADAGVFASGAASLWVFYGRQEELSARTTSGSK